MRPRIARMMVCWSSLTRWANSWRPPRWAPGMMSTSSKSWPKPQLALKAAWWSWVCCISPLHSIPPALALTLVTTGPRFKAGTSTFPS